MLTIQLKEEVRKVLASEWNEFAQRHPRLAEVIDQELLVEQAVSSLQSDLAYQQAMADASAAGIGAGALADLLRKLVTEWLRRLL